MKIQIKRLNKVSVFEVKKTNLLQALIEIKSYQDNSLSFRCGCKSGICGSCAVRVNGTEKLACKTKIEENDLIEAIKNLPIIKDLVVDVSHETLLIKKANLNIEEKNNETISQEDIKRIDLQSNCILCNICYSACPVFDVNEEFLGPFALSRALRYVNDKKLSNKINVLDSVQTNGIWNCILCGACTLVCPQSIDSKADIMELRNISIQNNYSDPTINNFDLSFNDDFGGFNPNGF